MMGLNDCRLSIELTHKEIIIKSSKKLHITTSHKQTYRTHNNNRKLTTKEEKQVM